MKVISYQSVKPKEGGPYSLFCDNCRRWIPNTANHEMKKEGVYAHGHACVKFEDGTIKVLLVQGIPEGGGSGMKQHVTVEQLQELTESQRIKLCKHIPGKSISQELTVGKMIEMLGNKIKHIDRTTVGWEVCIEYLGSSMYRECKELADALWQALLATL